MRERGLGPCRCKGSVGQVVLLSALPFRLLQMNDRRRSGLTSEKILGSLAIIATASVEGVE